MKAKLHKKKILAFGLILLSVTVSSCWYNHQWEEMHKVNASSSANGCSDTLGISMSYTLDIAPIMTNNCDLNNAGCHKAVSGNGDLSNYSGVAAFCSGSPSTMMASLQHTSSFPMPEGKPKLPDCEIAKVAKWIKQGYPNN